MMKTVVVVTDIPFWVPSYGSHNRILRLVRAISRENQVKIFYLRSFNAPAKKAFEQLGIQNCDVVSYKAFSGLSIAVPKRLAKEAFFRKYVVDDFLSAFAAFSERHHYDHVIFEYLRLGYMFDACRPNCSTLLDMHDVMSLRTLSLRRAGLSASIQIDAIAERTLLSSFTRILTISTADEKYITSKMGLKNSIYVPCSADAVWRRECSDDGKSLLFVGANSAPNLAGLSWFLKQVWPLLSSDGYKLNVVGTICDAFAGAPEGVHLVGQVDNLKPYVDGAAIAINPVFVGGGLKIKSLEALAAGLPCVTTVEGAAGMSGAEAAGLISVRTRLEFARAIERFAASRPLRELVAILAPTYIEQHFDDNIAYRDLRRFISSWSGAPAARPRAAVSEPGMV
jgi:glycosyltransferase involved in cell wall biosynthesis